MSKTYFIRGTIAIGVDGDNKSKIALTVSVAPCTGFLTPDNKPQKAIAFPDLYAGAAQLLVLNEKTCEFDAKDIEVHIPALLFIAGQQKPIELHVTKIEKNKKGKRKPKYKITGFVYPAPHA